ncbi:MAG: HAD hydrolase-like protein [Treponemataceae bacterium]|nr:HAD hydrolase-like protein [Treponemataceae bacterium]
MINLAVFDLGGTLMEYQGLHLSWISNYKKCFDYVNEKLGLGLTEAQIEKSIQILTDYNPRVKPREADIEPEIIFKDVTAGWMLPDSIPVAKIIDIFFEALELNPLIYEDSIPCLKALRERGIKIAVLTDVATGMPDQLHKNYNGPLLPYFDMYVSSLSCGFKKPNPKGLYDIAAFFHAEAENMLMIGDDKRDVLVAQRFGCKSVLIERPASDLHEAGRDYGQDFTITSLSELYDRDFDRIFG